MRICTKRCAKGHSSIHHGDRIRHGNSASYRREVNRISRNLFNRISYLHLPKHCSNRPDVIVRIRPLSSNVLERATLSSPFLGKNNARG